MIKSLKTQKVPLVVMLTQIDNVDEEELATMESAIRNYCDVDIFNEIEKESGALFNEAYDYYNEFSNQFLGNALVENRKLQKLPNITHFKIKKANNNETNTK